MTIKSNIKELTSAILLLAAGLVFTACSSSHGESKEAYYGSTGYSGIAAEPSGSGWEKANASSEQQKVVSSTTTTTTAAASQPAQAEAAPAQTAQAPSNPDEINIPLHQEKVSVVGKRQVDAGQVTIRKVITTETVNTPVELRKETLVIDRVDGTSQAVSSGGEAFAPFEAKTMTIRLQKEEPVIQKQTIVKGNVVAHRNAQIEQSSIVEQVREENVEVDKNNANNVVLKGQFYEIKEAAGAQPKSDPPAEQPKDQQQQKQQQDQQQK